MLENPGDRIQALRKQSKKTQKQLGDYIGRSAQVVSNYERGYTPTIPPDDLSKIATYFNVSVDYLLGLDAPIKAYEIPKNQKHEKSAIEFISKLSNFATSDQVKLLELLLEQPQEVIDKVYADAKKISSSDQSFLNDYLQLKPEQKSILRLVLRSLKNPAE